jgi:hypothetical protein
MQKKKKGNNSNKKRRIKARGRRRSKRVKGRGRGIKTGRGWFEKERICNDHGTLEKMGGRGRKRCDIDRRMGEIGDA